MFPLGTVLVPHQVLPLHVFEPRYRVLVFDCLRGDGEFGVVLIERGSEVGGADQRFGVATVARIAHATELPDGRWYLLAVGVRRIDVVEWLPDDPYPRARVTERPEIAWSEADGSKATDRADPAAALVAADQAVRRTVTLTRALTRAQATQLGEDAVAESVELSPDPAVAAWELVALAPLGSLDKQRLLTVDDPVERLGMLTAQADDHAFLLTHRLDRE
jgi:hypothetical protein